MGGLLGDIGTGVGGGGGGRSRGGVGGGVATGGRVAPRPAPTGGGIGSGVGQAAKKASPGPSQAQGVGGGLLTGATLQNPNSRFPFKLTGDYARAIAQVFAHQTPEVKAAILGHAAKLPWLPESQITLSQLHDLTDKELLKIGKAGGTNLPGGKDDPAAFVANVRSGQFGWRPQPGAKTDIGTSGPGYGLGYTSAYQKAAQQAGYTIDTKTGKPAYRVASASDLPGGLGLIPKIVEHPGQFAKNVGSDVIHLPENTVQGLYGIGRELVHGHVGNAIHMVTDPYMKFFHDPTGQSFGHPVNSLLMFSGPKAIAGKAAGDVARTGALGEKAQAFGQTARAPLVNPAGRVIEARSYSPDLFRKAGQVRREQTAAAKNIKQGVPPNAARPAPVWMPETASRVLNVGLAAKERQIADELTAVHGQMAAREGRSQGLHTIDQHTPKSKEAQGIAHLVLQNIVRTPQTAGHDLHQELGRLVNAAPGLKGARKTWNLEQQKAVQAAIKKPESINEAFRAANEPRAQGLSLRDSSNRRDAALVQNHLLDQEQAQRRRLAPYAMAHMGAKYDFKQGALVAHNGAPLPTEHILAHLAHNGHPEVRYDPAVGMVRDRPNPEYARQYQRAESVGTLLQGARSPGELAAARSRMAAMNERLAQTPKATQQVLAHTDTPLGHALPEPAYVGHFPGKTSLSNFVSSYSLSRGVKDQHGWTGEAFRNGAYDHTWEGLRGQAAKAEAALAKSGLHDALIKRLGITKARLIHVLGNDAPHQMRAGENGFFTAREAKDFAHDYGQKTGHELTPITAVPVKQLENMAHPPSLLDTQGIEFQAVDEAMRDAKVRGTKSGGPRNVVLIPADAAMRMREQYARGSAAGRAFGRVTQQFRRTVLPYSTHWMFQIGTEAVLRGLVEGAINPANIHAGRALFKQLEHTPQGKAALREMVNATFWNQHENLARFNPNPTMATRLAQATPGVARGGFNVRTPDVSRRGIHMQERRVSLNVVEAHNRYADAVGHTMYRMENEFRKMGMGKLAREQVKEWSGSWRKSVKLQGEAMQGLVDRLQTDPALVAKFGRSIDTAFGKYNKFGPTTRGMVQSVAPFLPWYLAASKFVLYHLPHNHPVAQSLAASLAQTVQNDVEHGKNAPLDHFKMAELARLTPFGIIGHNWPAAISDPWVPEASGAYNILHGKNVFGERDLRGPGGKPGEGERIWLAVNQFLESMMPLARYGKVARQGGATSYDTGTIFNPAVKPGQKGSVSKAANRILNPLHTLMAPNTAPPAAKHTNVLSTTRRGQDAALLLHPERIGPDGKIIKQPPKTRGTLRGWGGSSGGTSGTSLKGWGGAPSSGSSGSLKGWG